MTPAETARAAGGIAADAPGRRRRTAAGDRATRAPAAGFSAAISASTRLAACAQIAAADGAAGLERVIRVTLHHAGARHATESTAWPSCPRTSVITTGVPARGAR